MVSPPSLSTAAVLAVAPDHGSKRRNGQGIRLGAREVDHSMAIRTQRSKVLDGIDPIGLAGLADGPQVVHLDHSIGIGAVVKAEVKAAALADAAVVLKTFPFGLHGALVASDKDLLGGSLGELFGTDLRHRL